MTKSRATRTPPPKKARAVSRRHDPAEVQADKAADVVARGGSVTGWSFGSVPVDAGVHREDKGKPSEEDKLKEAAKKTGEAVLETEAGKKLQERVKETPLVKGATDFLGTTPGKVVAGGAIAAGVGGLAAAKQPLPIQAPAIPLDKITPGLSAKVTVEGPVNAPTFVGLSLTYKEQAKGGGKAGPTEKDKIAADTARLKAQAEMFKPQAQKDQEKADEQAAIARFVGSQQKLFGSSTLLPLKPADKPKSVDVPQVDTGEPQKDKEDAPVQREPATTAAHDAPALDTSGVEGAVRGGGRKLDPATRRSMEARFGYDFSSVRLHDDAAASSAAAGVEASAFTVGEDIVFGDGGYDPSTPQGRHLLAHELAHVIQQRGQGGNGAGEHLHRRSVFESIGILLGLVEGNWTEQELRAYLGSLTQDGKIDGSYDADNKARAIVRLWKQGAPGWDLLGPEKSLLIDEMLDGPTLGDDEACILDLLERSDAGDLRTIFADSQKRTLSLEDNIQGDNRIRLNAFEASRFQGGRTELLAGRVTVLGDAVPADAPTFAFSAAMFDARLDSDREPGDLISLIDHFSPDDRKKATDHLLHEVWPKARDVVGKAELEKTDAPTDEAKAVVDERANTASERARKTERILQHYFLGDVPASSAELGKLTKAVDPAKKEDLLTVLRPKQYSAELKAEKKQAEEDKKAGAGKVAAPVKVEPVTFHDPDKFRAEAEAEFLKLVKDLHTAYVTNAGKRGTKPEIERMAVVAKRETDAVFGQFYDIGKHPELQFDKKGKPGKLHFWYDEAELERKIYGDVELAKMWARYYFQALKELRVLNDKYGADPSFDSNNNPGNPEAKLIAKIIDKATSDTTTVTKLVETWRNWGGMAGSGNIYVDLFHRPDVDADRLQCWDMFQTLIHEYLHTLVDDSYEAYAKSFGPSSVQWNTLIEGVDCVLDEVVWARVVPKVSGIELRKVVEGEKNAKLPPVDVPPPGRYDSYPEAFRLVGLVGIQNVYAAYFLGKVDRISDDKDAIAKANKAKKGNK
jgi:hypothetical protein